MVAGSGDLSMERLNLNKTQLPASRFPEPADVYVCDNCGTDITEHLHRGRAHVWRPLGPSRYVCRCGRRYLSGAVEWDHLSGWEKRQRLRQIVGLLVLLFVPLAGFLCLLRATLEHGGVLLLALCAVAALPAIMLLVLLVTFVLDGLEVVASVWRTRVGRILSSRRGSKG